MLREITTLPKPIAEKLGRGLTESDCRNLFGQPSLAGLSFDKLDLAMPVIEIGSPTLEHLLQSFSTLFGRIGIPDAVDDDVAVIVALNMNQCRSAE